MEAGRARAGPGGGPTDHGKNRFIMLGPPSKCCDGRTVVPMFSPRERLVGVLTEASGADHSQPTEAEEKVARTLTPAGD